MIYQLEKHIADLLKDFFKNYEFVDKVVVFGSRAKHNANPKSDIDLCIYSLKMSDKEFSKLRLEIDDLPILQKLDVVHFEKVNAELKNNVEKDGKLLYKRVKKVKLDDVLDVQNGYAFDSKFFNYKEGVQLIRIRDLKNGIKTEVKYSADFDERFLVYKGDYLIGMDGDFICYEWKGEPSLLNQRVCRLVNFTTDIEPKYIYYGINKSLKKIHDSTSFVTVKHISSKQIKEIEFPMIPLEKQKQIAKTLDKANELVELRKESITKLDTLAKSIFIDMFGDPVSNPKGWNIKELENLVTKDCTLSYGIVQPGDDFENGIPIVRPVDLGNLKLENLKKTDPKISNSYKKTILYGDEILLSVRGTTGTLGLATIELTTANVTRGIVPIRFESHEKKLFIYGVLASKPFQQIIQEKTYGATLKQINLSEVRKLKIINPPIQLQNKFAKIIEKIEEQKSLYEKELELLQINFDALLQKSFQE